MIEMSQFTDLTAQFGFSRRGAVYRARRRGELGRRLCLQHRGKSAALSDVDDLLLRNPAHRTEPVLGRGETHDGIERLREHPAVGADDGKFMYRKARGQL